MGITTTMISWQLWRALQTPFVAHPLYWRRAIWQRRILLTEDSWWTALQQHMYKYQLVWFSIFILAGVSITALMGPAPLLLLFFGLPFLLTLVGPPLFLLLIGTFYGLVSALAISDSIVRERIQGRYTLLGLTPYGLVGATWALCSLELHTHEGLKQARSLLTGLYIILCIIMSIPLFFGLLMLIMSPQNPFVQVRFYEFVHLSAILMTPFIDYIQSTNTGCLIGMIVPTYTMSRANARALTLTSFLALQFGTYLLVAFLSLVLWPRLYAAMHIDMGISYILLSLLTFYICREIIVLSLWYLLAHRLESGMSELNDITRIKVIRFLPRGLATTLANLLKRSKPLA